MAIVAFEQLECDLCGEMITPGQKYKRFKMSRTKANAHLDCYREEQEANQFERDLEADDERKMKKETW